MRIYKKGLGFVFLTLLFIGLVGILIQREITRTDRIIKMAADQHDLRLLKPIIIDGKTDKRRQAIEVIGDILYMSNVNSNEYKEGIGILSEILMSKDKFLDIYDDAAQLMFNFNEKNIIEPFKSDMNQKCKRILQNSHFVSIGNYIPKGQNILLHPRTRTLFEFEGREEKYEKQIFFGMTPLQLTNFLERISSITYIKETKNQVGHYMPGGADAYVICWEVWVIDLNRGISTANKRFIGGYPPPYISRYDFNFLESESGSLPPYAELRNWLFSLPKK
jgi:hypothetical protein